MSITINNQNTSTGFSAWSGASCSVFIQKGREKRGCAVEELASLAGMESSEWLALKPAVFQSLRRSYA
jgi:hypothetical protein